MMATNANEAPARYQRRTFPTVGGLTRIEVMIFVLAFTQMEPLFYTLMSPIAHPRPGLR